VYWRVAVVPPPYLTTGSGTRPGLSEVAVTVSAWADSSAGPAVMPDRLTVCCAASSSAETLPIGLIFPEGTEESSVEIAKNREL
jgi:hypothetical protein